MKHYGLSRPWSASPFRLKLSPWYRDTCSAIACAMAPKKQTQKAQAKTPAGPACKKARTGGGDTDAQVATTPHPTMSWMMDILNTLDCELKALEKEPAEAFAGIAAFDAKTYVENMTNVCEYECNVTLSRHKLLHLEHEGVWPAVGSIKRIVDSVFCDSDGEPLACFPHSISVRAVSTVDAPDQLERLHHSTYLFAFLAAWANAKTAGKKSADNFYAFARRIRTRFLYLPDDDDARRKKWNLQEKADNMADNDAILTGYKKTLGVVAVQQDLQSRGLPHDPAAVAAWFKTVQFNDPADRLAARDVSRHIRVYNRLSADPTIMARLDLIESRFGRRHALSSLFTLDSLCSKTNVQSNPQLSAALLVWVVDGMTVLMLRGCIKPDAPRDAVGNKIVPKLLLIRRIVQFLLNRFRYAAQPGVTYLDGYSPENIGKTLFSSWTNFHREHPTGLSLDPTADDKTSSCGPSPAYLAKLAPSHAYLLEFIASLMTCNGDIDGIVTHSVSQEANLSAESFFERRVELVRDDIFDLNGLTDRHKSDISTPEPPQPPPPPAATVARPVEADKNTTPDEAMPDAEQPVEEDDKNTSKHFPSLIFCEAAEARLNSVERARFAAMVSHAERRISPWVDLKILPTDPAAIPEYIKATQAVQQLESEDKMMYIWCAGTASESIHPARLSRPYKYPAPLDKVALENAVGNIAATPEEGTAGDKNKSLFTTHPSILIASDGRRESSHRTINGVLNKTAKNSGGAVKNATSFRLMHSNAEFTNNRNLRGDATKTVPEPLETLSICATADFKVRPVGRKYLDLPGTNRTRGLNNVPLKIRTASITWATRCEILSGSSKTVPADDDAFGWMDVDDEEDQAEGDDDDDKTADISSQACDLYPWEHNELVCRELINCFDPKTVVHFNTGGPSWPLACARHSRHFIGFVRNAEHLQYVNKTLVASVVSEMIEGKQDGFSVRRFLSAQRSLGGSTEDGSSVAQPKVDEAKNAAEATADEEADEAKNVAEDASSSTSDDDE